MADFMRNLFGTYEPLTYTATNGAIIPIEGVAGADWQYIGSVAIFCIFIFSLFKFIGSAFRR